MNVSDNGMAMTNRATVNHRAVATADNVAHHQRVSTAPTAAAHTRAEVVFKRLAFYDVLAEIMKPSSLGLLCLTQLLLNIFFLCLQRV